MHLINQIILFYLDNLLTNLYINLKNFQSNTLIITIYQYSFHPDLMLKVFT